MKRRIFLPVILLVILLSVPFMARAGSENDQSWMRPIPPEPAVYASIPEFKGAPMPPTISTEETDSGIRFTVEGLTVWGVSAETLSGKYYIGSNEIESTLNAVGGGKWTAELPEDAFLVDYMTAGADGTEIYVTLDPDESKVHVDIRTGSFRYYVMDNEEIWVEWQPSETEYTEFIDAAYSRATGGLVRYRVTISDETDCLEYVYEADDAGGMELTTVQYSFADPTNGFLPVSYEYIKDSDGWTRIDYETGETLKNAELPEDILALCVELPLV